MKGQKNIDKIAQLYKNNLKKKKKWMNNLKMQIKFCIILYKFKNNYFIVQFDQEYIYFTIIRKN